MDPVCGLLQPYSEYFGSAWQANSHPHLHAHDYHTAHHSCMCAPFKLNSHTAGGAGLLLHFGNSPFRLLQTVFPEYQWQPWAFVRVPQGYGEKAAVTPVVCVSCAFFLVRSFSFVSLFRFFVSFWQYPQNRRAYMDALATVCLSLLLVVSSGVSVIGIFSLSVTHFVHLPHPSATFHVSLARLLDTWVYTHGRLVPNFQLHTTGKSRCRSAGMLYECLRSLQSSFLPFFVHTHTAK